MHTLLKTACVFFLGMVTLGAEVSAATCPSTTSGLEWGNGSDEPSVYSGCKAGLPQFPTAGTFYWELQSYQANATVTVARFTLETDTTPSFAPTSTINLGSAPAVTAVEGSCTTSYPEGVANYNAPVFKSDTTYCAYVKTDSYVLAIEGTTQTTQDQLFINPSARYYPLNSAPTDINLTSTDLAENSEIGTTIGELNAIDTDIEDTHTYSLACATPGVNDGNFTIDGSTLKSNYVFDYETGMTQTICIQVTDSANTSFEKNIIIAINDVNESQIGECGNSHEQVFTTSPSENLCFIGTPSSVSFDGNIYSWSCQGTTVGAHTGANVTCEASLATYTVIFKDIDGTIFDTQTVKHDTAALAPTQPTKVGYSFEGWSPTDFSHISSDINITAQWYVIHDKDGVTATSELEVETDYDSDGNIVTTATTTNSNNDSVTVEVVAKATGDVKATHSLTINNIETKAESELPNTATVIKAEGDVETTATLSENGSEIKVVASSDGTASHEVKRSDDTVSQTTSEIKGALTYITQDGDVETSVEPENYSDANGCSVKAVVLTDKDGESRSEFVKECNGVEDKQLTVSQSTPFESGNTVRIYEDVNMLKIEVQTPVTKRLQF